MRMPADHQGTQRGRVRASSVDPSEDVTVEATRRRDDGGGRAHTALLAATGTAGVSAGQRAPTLLGVPIHSLPLPGVSRRQRSLRTARTDAHDRLRRRDHGARAADAEARRDAARGAGSGDSARMDERPSIDRRRRGRDQGRSGGVGDEGRREHGRRDHGAVRAGQPRTRKGAAPNGRADVDDDLEFADPDGDEHRTRKRRTTERRREPRRRAERRGRGDQRGRRNRRGRRRSRRADPTTARTTHNDGVATATFMKPADSTGLSGLLSPRRPPTGGRDGFGSRLPTPYPAPQRLPAPVDLAVRVAPRSTADADRRPTVRARPSTPMPAIQVPPPSGAATTASGPGFFSKQVPRCRVSRCSAPDFLALGFGLRGAFSGGKSAPPTADESWQSRPRAAPAAPAVPVVEPVAGTTRPRPSSRQSRRAHGRGDQAAAPDRLPAPPHRPSSSRRRRQRIRAPWKTAKKPAAEAAQARDRGRGRGRAQAGVDPESPPRRRSRRWPRRRSPPRSRPRPGSIRSQLVDLRRRRGAPNPDEMLRVSRTLRRVRRA